MTNRGFSWIWLLACTGILFVSTHFFLVLTRPVLDREGGDSDLFPKQEYQRIAQSVTKESLASRIRALSNLESRVSGSLGGIQAMEWIQKELRQIPGMTDIKTSAVTVTYPVDSGAMGVADGQSQRFYPLWAPHRRLWSRTHVQKSPIKTIIKPSITNPFPLGAPGSVWTLALPPKKEALAIIREFYDGLSFPDNDDEKFVEPEMVWAEAWLKKAVEASAIVIRSSKIDLRLEDRHPMISGLLQCRMTPLMPPVYAHLDDLGSAAALTIKPAHSTLTSLSGKSQTRLYPLWPNDQKTSSLEAGGLIAPLVYGGDGSTQALSGQIIDGAIVLVDWEPGRNFLNLASLGASAVLFAEPESYSRVEMEQKVLTVSADLPRFWIRKETLQEIKSLVGTKVRLDCQQVWEPGLAPNLTALLPGTDPNEEAFPVLLTAPYDSLSLVPELAPGAEQAAGAAILLELAEVLSSNRVRKPVKFLFYGGRNQGYLGLGEYTHALVLQKRDKEGIYAEALPSLVLSFENTSQSPHLTVFFTGHLIRQGLLGIQRMVSPLGARLAGALQIAAKELGHDPDIIGDGVNPISGRSWASYLLGRFSISGELPMLGGFHSYTFSTSEDARLRVSTPADTFENINMDNLALQARILACALPNVLNVRDAFSRMKLPDFWTSMEGRVVRMDPRVSYLPDRTVPGALVRVQGINLFPFLGGVMARPILTATGDSIAGGSLFHYHGLPSAHWISVGGWRGTASMLLHVMDPLSGRLTHSLDYEAPTKYNYQYVVGNWAKLNNVNLVAFRSDPLNLFGIAGPRHFRTLQGLEILEAASNSPPFEYTIELPSQYWEADKSEPVAVVRAPPKMKVKIILSSGALGAIGTMTGGTVGRRGALLGSTEDDPTGKGFVVGKGSRVKNLSLQIARDMVYLNKDRMSRFMSQGISNQRAEDLLNFAAKDVQIAEKALVEMNYSVSTSKARSAWGTVSRAYPDIRSTGDDVVRSAMFFLFLMLPFAFAMERLFVASGQIKQQVIWIAAIFAAVFLVFRQIHPAFRIALTPLLILLAFVIFTLAVIVMIIIVNRFLRFIKEERQSTEGIHESDAKKGAITWASLGLGVSNLRKRPLRTGLTSATLALLIFGILSLTSLQQTQRHREFSLENKAPYNGLLFRERTWSPLARTAEAVMQDEFGSDNILARRGWWISRATDRQLQIMVSRGNSRVPLLGLLGLDPEEEKVTKFSQALISGTFFEPGQTGRCILSESRAELLGAKTGDSIILGGKSFILNGIFDESKVAQLLDLDGEPILPVDFKASNTSRAIQQTASSEESAPQIFEHHQASDIGIVTYDDLRALGGDLQSIALPTEDPERARAILEPLISRMDILIYAGLSGEAKLHSAAGTTTAKGLPNILIPLLLAALIVGNTMLGSVQERTKEIAIFSSVGLAPRHVRNLFLAEAMVYAVVGAVIGTLLAQGLGRILLRLDLLKGITLNYSSSSTVVSVVLVMAVVLLSTLYPASVAARVARPSDLKRLVIPEGQSGKVTISLPFSVQGKERQGMAAFLFELFDSHQDASTGDYSSADVRIDQEPNGDCHVRATLWLAPHDFGVSQEIDIFLANEASLTINRLSGDEPSWRRANLRYLLSMRKQFLVWRSQTADNKESYAHQATKLFSELATT